MWGVISNVSAITGIVGISFTNWLEEPEIALAALAIFALVMGYAAYRAYLATKHVLDLHYPKGHVSLSSVMKYTTSDGLNIVYEQLRHIQVKKPAMRSFEHRFLWTGTKPPIIKSELQTPSQTKPIPGENGKVVHLNFPQTRTYNSVEVIHILMECDDSDQQSIPRLSQRVEEPLQLITFDVELLHATNKYTGEHAKLCKKSAEKGLHAIEELIATIPFNPMTKSFAYQLRNPEPGYIYVLSWNKPPLPSMHRRKGDKTPKS